MIKSFLSDLVRVLMKRVICIQLIVFHQHQHKGRQGKGKETVELSRLPIVVITRSTAVLAEHHKLGDEICEWVHRCMNFQLTKQEKRRRHTRLIAFLMDGFLIFFMKVMREMKQSHFIITFIVHLQLIFRYLFFFICSKINTFLLMRDMPLIMLLLKVQETASLICVELQTM